MNVTVTMPFIKGKSRPRFSNGRAYTPRSTHDAERAIASEYRATCVAEFGRVMRADRGTPVTVAVMTERNVRSRTRRREGDTQPDVDTPDVDNVAKLVLDALNGVAWADDAQVNELHVYKLDRQRGCPPRTTVVIEWSE